MFDSKFPITPSAEHGMTLVELLVGMVAAIAIMGALLGILEISLGEQTRIADRVQADRKGRLAMQNAIDELHSSCTGFGATAIQAPATAPVSPLASSGALDLWFLSAYGTASAGNASLSGVAEHDIHWASTGTSNTGQTLGTLTDYAFASTGGTSPNWTFPELKTANAKARVLATKVIPPTVSGASTIFQYYKYSSGELVAVASKEAAAAAKANQVAKVTVGFTQAAEDGDTRSDRTANFNDAVVLRFNPTESGAEANNEPCA